jgi:hypothetical protein
MFSLKLTSEKQNTGEWTVFTWLWRGSSREAAPKMAMRLVFHKTKRIFTRSDSAPLVILQCERWSANCIRHTALYAFVIM